MAQFDAYVNPEGRGWLLDVQSDELFVFRTRLVVPLVGLSTEYPMTPRLNPILVTDVGDVVLLTHLLFAVPRSILKQPEFNVSDTQDAVKSALDMAFYGF